MISIAKEKEIRLLAGKGLSIRTIAKTTGISRPVIRVVKQLKELRPRPTPDCKLFERLQQPRKCPTCGAEVITWPCVLCYSRKRGDGLELIIDPPKQQMSQALFTEFLYIVLDIRDLHKLNLISHPLFCHLADRAEQSLSNTIHNGSV